MNTQIEMRTIKFSSDQPVSQKKDDQFSRWNFAKRISTLLSNRIDPSCITIGLYGAWGNGKSSVLKFVENILKKDDNIICINFNPWRFTTQDELLIGFFNYLANTLDEKLLSKKEWWKNLLGKSLPTFGSLIGSKSAGDFAKSFLNGPDINEFKTRVEKILEQKEKKILILIDDIDRLENDEIHAIFKLIKQTADFKYTAYLLAFDKEVVAKSLANKYSGSSSIVGADFLEKIIQIPLNLPHPGKKEIRSFFYKEIENSLISSDTNLTNDQGEEFTSYFIKAFDDYLSTPRKAKLYGNILSFSLPILKDEVNPVDLMLIEAIRVFFPNLYEVLRTNSMFYDAIFDQLQLSQDKEFKIELKAVLVDALKKDEVINIRPVFNLLESLFPKLVSSLQGMKCESNSYDQWANEQRVCSIYYFRRYFSYSILPDDVADSEINSLIDYCKNNDPSIDSKWEVIEPISEQNAENVLYKLRKLENELERHVSQNLTLFLCMRSHLFKSTNNLFAPFSEPIAQAAILINALIFNLDARERVKHYKKCVELTQSVNFKLELLRWLKVLDENKPDKVGFKIDEKQELGNYCVDVILKDLEAIDDITDGYPVQIDELLAVIRKYKGEEIIHKFIQPILNDKNSLIRLLDSYRNISYSVTIPNKFLSDFDRNEYERLSYSINPNVIYGSIIELGDDTLLNVEDFPKYINDSNTEKVIKQFVWIHTHALSNDDSFE